MKPCLEIINCTKHFKTAKSNIYKNSKINLLQMLTVCDLTPCVMCDLTPCVMFLIRKVMFDINGRLHMISFIF